MSQKQSWFNRLFNPSGNQFPNSGREIIPTEVRSEYQLPNDGVIRDKELVEAAPEMDFNAKRNLVQPHTFWK
jgi:hypothetical protein